MIEDEAAKQVRSYQDLSLWKAAMDLAEACYSLTRSFPKDEMFGLTSQIRRAATSIPCNIAEGWGREGTREFIHFLRISQGSIKELETLLIPAQRVGLARHLGESGVMARIAEVSRKTKSLINSLSKKLQ